MTRLRCHGSTDPISVTRRTATVGSRYRPDADRTATDRPVLVHDLLRW
jgi:hypothetical protein